MLFNSPVFIFVFLPVVLVVYLLAGKRLRNPWLGIASLFFYCWGEPLYFPVILVSILVNFFFGRWLGRFQEDVPKAKWALAAGVLFNLALLVLFRDYTVYWLNWLGNVFASLNLAGIATWLANAARRLSAIAYLPLGISFFTFSTISYLVDVHKKRCPSEVNLFNFTLYVLLFPKIIAGPIARYSEVAGQLLERSVSLPGLADGARRFAMGFSKKVLIADTLGPVVNQVFALNSCGSCPYGLTPGLAWLGVSLFTLQIYFDFSGYSDMAIGLGQMFGFKFIENFDYPYISRSITEFWRRWHISLSNWFRDYVFYPLERGSRRGRPRGGFWVGFSQYANILIVFLLTGLWHGAAVNFVVWGLIHGLAIALERSPFGKWLKSVWWPLQHVYTLAVIMVGWVFFRAENLGAAIHYLKAMLGFTHGSASLPFAVLTPVEPYLWFIFSIAILFAMPLLPTINRYRAGEGLASRRVAIVLAVLQDAVILGLLVVAIIFLSSTTHQAYIYMRF